MLILIHVIIALSSIAYTSYIFISPSHTKLQASYVLMGLTLTTGTYLTWLKPAHMLQSCMMGLVYIAIVTVGILATKHKLALAKN
jgi:hypothetical protein